MKNKTSIILIFYFCIVSNFTLQSQDLLKKLDTALSNQNFEEIATFKTTRLGLGHSIETRKKGALQISLYNRYWNIPDFNGQRFLADVVSTRYGLEYAFTNDFTFGAGYTNYDKISDAYLKYSFLKQYQNSSKKVLSLTFLQTISHVNIENNTLYESSNINGFSFTSQLLVARKINQNLSLQITPMYIFSESNKFFNETKNQFAVAFGGRHKINPHTEVVSEYFYVANPLKSIQTYNAFLVGINWEVGDLMLQFHITNARNFAEDTFITRTSNNFNFKDGNLHFGFNATYIFHTKKNKL